MPAQIKQNRKGSAGKTTVESALVQRATDALLKNHQSVQDAKSNPSLLGDDLAIQVQFGLELVPEHPSPKPIRVEIPHALYKLSEESADEGLEEPSVCLIVKEESKPWVKELIEHFPEQLKFVKKVLGLQSLRKKHARFQQRRELVRRYDVFMADDRILPMLTKALGKEFFHVKKQPIPIVVTRKEALPFSVVKALQSTFLYIPAGTCLTVRAGTTGMPTKKLVENIQAVIRNASPRIPRKWANIRSIAIKTPSSMSLPIYSKTPEELVEIAKLAGLDNNQELKAEEEEEELQKKVELMKRQKKLAAAKSPLVQALKKQKKLEEDSGKDERKSKPTNKKGMKRSKSVSEKSVTDSVVGKSAEVAKTVNVKKARTSETPAEPDAAFIESKKFAGSKKDYVFRNGEKGVGYYVDVKPIVDKMAMDALKRLGASSGGGRKPSKKGRRGRR